MSEIILHFKKDETRLAGFNFGKETYTKQVREKIYKDGILDKHIVIVFPDQIERVASSFIQGFFLEMINTIGYDEIFHRFEIRTASEKLQKSILENIY